MNQISRLIAKLCPLGVGFQLLGNLEDSGVVKLGRGNVISKTDLASSPGDYPVYSSSAAGSGEFGRYGKFMFEDERITWSIDGGGRFFYRSPHNYSVTNVCGWLKVVDSSKISTRFLFHVLTGLWETKVFDYTKKAHPSVIREEYLIPLPPIEIQIEIVRILDAFTELTTELTTELSARQRQYNYYRDQLLSFAEDEVEWKPLGELAENLDSMRKPVTSGLREFGEIPYYGASGIVDYVKDYIFDGDYLLVSEDGANLIARNTPIAFSISGKSWVNNHAHILKFENYVERKYIEYYLNSIDLTPYISGAAQPKLNQRNLNSIKIPNPLYEEKTCIVAILDKFDTLTNSINEGLPREIALRQQQYEYYRDLLLSFPRPEATAAVNT